MKKAKLSSCYFRLSADLKKRLDEFSKSSKRAKSHIIIEALEEYLAQQDEDFSFAIEALEELKDGDFKKAGKKIDKAVKKLKG